VVRAFLARPRFPEWDYHPASGLSFEFELYVLGGSAPRRSFRDARIQRLANMVSEIAVGLAVLAAGCARHQVVDPPGVRTPLEVARAEWANLLGSRVLDHDRQCAFQSSRHTKAAVEKAE
jgi:hypothetical protein